MASAEPTISKRRAAGTIRYTALTIPQTLQIIRKLGSDPRKSIIMVAGDNGFLTKYGIKKHKKKITCRNLGQKR